MALVRSLDPSQIIVIPDDTANSHNKNIIVNAHQSATLRDDQLGATQANPIVLGENSPPRSALATKAADPTPRKRKANPPTRQPPFNLRSGPIRNVPSEHYNKLKSCKILFEKRLVPLHNQRAPPEHLIRSSTAPRRTFRPGRLTGACWLEDYNPGIINTTGPRLHDPDALPRWFGPLTYTTLYFNNNRLPRTSLEFFHLCFVPIEPGDMEVWVQYRQIEEDIWVERLDFHDGFKGVLWALNGIAFGQKGAGAVQRVKQMKKVMERWREDIKTQAWGPWVGKDYFLWGVDQ